ncbi:MAG TPA: hypothetical protein VFU33_00980 [Gaiellaceae bacterium]|nr:hypothetical protein [Gaiellaceae bacterium]
MGKLALVLGAAVAVCLFAAGRAASNPVFAGQCGIRAQQTVWGEYGWPSLLPILAKPGTLLAVTTQYGRGDYAARARARGAATYAFDLKLSQKVGTPSKPADPSTIAAAAEAQYKKAVARDGGCATPLDVENELFGAGIPTPWTASTAQYRANVLAFLQDLAAKGAHPVLLINKSPYAGSSDAVAWWRSVSQVADIVREVYLPATNIWPLGPVLGSRFLRQSYRSAIAEMTSLGIPANRVGIMLSFLSHRGVGGRNGLEPASAWYQVVKWEALAAKQVAKEVGLGSIFSWGWQMWNKREMDPDKRQAACVWLWARTRSLCNAPRMLGKRFDRSLTAGQILLPGGTVCRTEGIGSVGGRALSSLEALTGDREAALSALFERIVESSERPVSRHAVLAAQREVIRDSFHGKRSAYVAALKQAHATVGIALSVLGDELRRARLEQPRYAPKPTASEVATFYATYPDLLVRRVHASPAPPWLGARTGFAVEEAAPQRLFSLPSGRKSRLSTLLGTFAVRPLGAPQALGALPFQTVRRAIVAALRGFERAQSFERWTIGQQNHALNRTICLRDQLPQSAAIDLTEYLPFLRIQ